MAATDANIGVDNLERPLRIPASFGNYAEEHNVYRLMQEMLKGVVIELPSDPLAHMLQFLATPLAPRVVLYAADGAVTTTVATDFSARTKVVHVTIAKAAERMAALGLPVAVKVKAGLELHHSIADSDLLEVMVARLKQADCVSLGYLLTDFPATKVQACALQTRGHLISHFFYLPTAGQEGREMSLKTQELLACYTHRTFTLAPALDAAAVAMYAHVCKLAVSKGPFIPRIILAGAPGAGSWSQAQKLANKYALVPVDGYLLARQAVASKSKVGMAIKPFMDGFFAEQGIPDDLLAGLVDARLSQLDCQRRGWALTNFPRNLRQAELLRAAGHGVNRVCFLDVSSATAASRIGGRRMDSATGALYHKDKQFPSDAAILERLVQHPEYTEEKVLEAHVNYAGANCRAELADYYPTGVPVDANMDSSAVFDCIDACIIKPHVDGPSIL